MPALPVRCSFFGTYPRAYTVTQILRAAAIEAGFEVEECHVPVWEKHVVKTIRYFEPLSVTRRGAEYVWAAFRLARAYLKRSATTDVWLVGFQGQLDMILLRLLRPRVPVVFAPLVSLTETLVDDRQWSRPSSFAGRVLSWLDRRSLQAADVVLSDTATHAAYLQEKFTLPGDKLRVFHLGPDWSTFHATRPREDGGPARVLFYGSFLPLHGVSTILGAAELLTENSDIHFTLCGDGWEYTACYQTAQRRRLRNVTFLPWMPYGKLPELIAGHDICLGIFGTGPKTAMVIPNKLYQCAAMGRPVVSADTQAVREVFIHGETAYLVPAGDAEQLAKAIGTLAADRALRHRLGQQACELMLKKFSPAAQGQRFRDIVFECLQR